MRVSHDGAVNGGTARFRIAHSGCAPASDEIFRRRAKLLSKRSPAIGATELAAAGEKPALRSAVWPLRDVFSTLNTDKVFFLRSSAIARPSPVTLQRRFPPSPTCTHDLRRGP